jgi:hypothetical protein
MTPSSEERVPEQTPPHHKARILPFERPQSVAQRAVQQRAQETLDLEQTRSKIKVTKLTPLRWLLLIVIAAIPMALTLGAVDGILRAMGMVNAMYQKEDTQRVEPPPVEEESSPQEPGVIMLKTFPEATQTPAAAPDPADAPKP